MRMAFLGLLGFASPTLAQSDMEAAMAMQACIHSCLATYGLNSAEYPTCVTTQCEGGAAPAPATAPAAVVPSSTSADRWAYTTLDPFGTGAAVQASGATLHLGCLPSGGAEPTVSLSVVAPSFQGERALLGFSNAGDMVALSRVGRGNYTLNGYACDLPIGALRAARAAVLVDGSIASMTAGQPTVVSSGGTSYAIESGAHLAGIPGAMTVPLSGSSAAIGQLIAGCPALAQDLQTSCD